MFIYKVTNKLNNKVYIGQTNRSVEDRWKEHCKPALQGRSALSAAIQKYGENNFDVEILAKCNIQKSLDVLERMHIKQANSMAPNGYNLKDGGSGGRLSKEAKTKISKANIGREVNEETRLKLSIASTGRTPPNCRPVIGTHIITGETIRLASPMAMPEKFHYNCIHRCAKGERKQHRGYKWKYE